MEGEEVGEAKGGGRCLRWRIWGVRSGSMGLMLGGGSSIGDRID